MQDLSADMTTWTTNQLVNYAKVSITEQRETNRLLRVLVGEAELVTPLPVARNVEVTRPKRVKRKWRNDRPTKEELDRDFSGFLR